MQIENKWVRPHGKDVRVIVTTYTMRETAEDYLDDWENFYEPYEEGASEERDFYDCAWDGEITENINYKKLDHVSIYAQKGLLIACLEGHKKDAMTCLSLLKGKDLIWADDPGYTALDLGLQLVVKHHPRYRRVARALLDAGADPESSIIRAICDSDDKMLKALQKLGVRCADGNGYISCYFTSHESDWDTGLVWAKKLIQMGASMEGEERDDLLWSACMNNHHESIKLLVEQGADMEQENGELLYRLVMREEYETAHLLLHLGCRKDLEGSMFEAVKHGNLVMTETLLDCGADVHEYRDFVLRRACADGRLDLVKLLVDRGADIHVKRDGALRRACRNRRWDVVEYLIQQGCDPDLAWEDSPKSQYWKDKIQSQRMTDLAD